jgi:hypothetical protein
MLYVIPLVFFWQGGGQKNKKSERKKHLVKKSLRHDINSILFVRLLSPTEGKKLELFEEI